MSVYCSTKCASEADADAAPVSEDSAFIQVVFMAVGIVLFLGEELSWWTVPRLFDTGLGNFINMLANGMAIALVVTIGLLLIRKARSSSGTDALQHERALQSQHLEALEEKKIQRQANEAVVNIAQHGLQVEGTIKHEVREVVDFVSCQHCGGQHLATLPACSHCGAPREAEPTPPEQQRGPCPHCHELIVSTARKCRFCHERLDDL
tara:strand:+ start:567 stop:1187 length:621 start_codon:yes stop_codon:yes gene_type:complete